MRATLLSAEPVLFVHGVTAEAWAKRWGIEPFEHPCYDCGRICKTTEPFAQGRDYHGLRAPTCACGNERTPYCVVGPLVAPPTPRIAKKRRRS